MKPLLYVALLIAAPAYAANVSISIGEPGFYGRLDIGGYPPPRIIYAAPRVVYPTAASRAPVYLHVPPGHARHWRKHCHEYNACGERVYFVQDSWYDHDYVPQYQQRHRENRNGPDGRGGDSPNGEGHDRGDDHGHGSDHGGRGGNGHGRS